MTLPSNTALDGVALKDISLPRGTLVISLIRRGVLTIPTAPPSSRQGMNWWRSARIKARRR